ncbi:SMI1/KNR4 family protein [Micromonospora sp. NBC_01796]|uniref:SMI1/KNR4 family protein n=1 Tax=Micromonospora sp. NBC_01796 TaxID=2975987 RepID=UPI002DDBAA78|nr:SMI1/KNR4 family protein [Micromonospora sp. NBC_01796]WSA85077.1 SMI1/KNR4 family protein [Micromonospora sp. NBC_01796]
MTDTDSGSQPPGARFAMSVIHPGSPVLRVRYRQGVLVTPYGYPDWALCARAVVELPPPVPGLSRDEVRVVDVLAANAAMARWAAEPDGDPLWVISRERHRTVPTPVGWCWAHVALTRQLALVPIELHGSFRHGGGLSTLPVAGRGLRLDERPVPVAAGASEPVPEEMVALLETALGWPLPEAYRRFLAATNGAGPAGPGVLPGHGFVADQPLFGIAREDRHQDLSYLVQWLRDRLTVDFLPIGYVQGGLLAVRVSGGDLDSVWYLDDDDPRDRDGYDAEYICANLLRRCADSIDDFWARLVQPSRALLAIAESWVDADQVIEVRADPVGAGLPSRMKAPWQPPVETGRDTLVALFEAR